MKINIASILLGLALVSSPARAMITFDALPSGPLASGYTEAGIQLTSPTGFEIYHSSFAAVLMGTFQYAGKVAAVTNTGWIGISSPGSLLDSVSFTYGFDWSDLLIESGLMDTTFKWRALLNGIQIETGGQTSGQSYHGGKEMEVNPEAVFDTLEVRSTAIAYVGIPQGLFSFTRGEAIDYGDQNHIALDNVNVNTFNFATDPENVPENGSTLAMGLFVLVGMFATRREQKHVLSG